MKARKALSALRRLSAVEELGVSATLNRKKVMASSGVNICFPPVIGDSVVGNAGGINDNNSRPPVSVVVAQKQRFREDMSVEGVTFF